MIGISFFVVLDVTSYALYRDERETVHNATGTILGCIVLACEDLLNEVSSFEVSSFFCFLHFISQ